MKTIIARSLGAALSIAVMTGASAQESPQSYVVVLRPGAANVPAVAQDLARAYGGRVGFVYEHALQGFSINASPRAATALASSPLVAYVEQDMLHTISAQDIPTGIERIFADGNAGLDIDGTDDYRVDVDVAVIDTGIDWQHPDLNVVGGINCASGNPFRANCGGNGDDDHYHGTHVAGTIGALDNGIGVVGVAPGARLWAVKVLNSQGSGYTSWIVAGIDWVTARAAQIEVANMSLGGSGFSQAEYDAIQGAVNAGVAFAVAAGNSNADANNFSPGGFDNVLSVSALADFDGSPGGLGAPTCRNDQDDTLASFSNWGPEVDIVAPGVCIRSTYPLEKGEYGTISGTSMASPHVAGALALLASQNNPGNAQDVSYLYSAVTTAGNDVWTDDSPDGIQEPLLDVGGFKPRLVLNDGGGGGGSTNTAPTAAFVYSCGGLTCTFTDSSSDPDGTLKSWLWNFGDGQTSTEQTLLAHTYSTGGDKKVTLTVTDDSDASAMVEQTVTVVAPGDIVLGVSAYKIKGVKYADLSWSDTKNSVDIYRDGVEPIATSSAGSDGSYPTSYNDGADGALGKGGGTATYWVCEANTTKCSNKVTVIW